MMGSLQIRFPEMGFVGKSNWSVRVVQNQRKFHCCSLMVVGLGLGLGLGSGSGSGFCSKMKIRCGLRGEPKKPLWKSRGLSSEAIQVVQALKLAKSNARLDEVFSSRLNRLLKVDLIATLKELQRQNELELAIKVFEFVRKEVWYKPDLSLYSGMIFMLGKHKLIKNVEELYLQLVEEGFEPDTRTYTEMIGAFLKVNMVEKAMETYRTMKESGCVPDKLTLTILIRNLENAGEEELVSTVKKDCEQYMDYPDKFLEEVATKYPKRKPVEIV